MNEVQPKKGDLTPVQKHVSLFEPSQYPVEEKMSHSVKPCAALEKYNANYNK